MLSVLLHLDLQLTVEDRVDLSSLSAECSGNISGFRLRALPKKLDDLGTERSGHRGQSSSSSKKLSNSALNVDDTGW